MSGLRAALGRVPVTLWIESTVGYWAEQRLGVREMRRRLRAAFEGWFEQGGGGDDVVWAHNVGLGRNFILAQELVRVCEARGLRCLLHHHDWWFDNRWQRWPELRRCAGSLIAAARGLLPARTRLMHVGINREDVAVLQTGFGDRAAWLPNSVQLARVPSHSRNRAVRRWVAGRTDPKRPGPIWLLPCRFLRRKNVAEAILLTRWLRPEAWLVTTGAPSSAAERPACERLANAARAGGWRVRLGILADAPGGAPGVLELMAASEALCFTSLLEGFGLPYLEAAAAGRPLLARSLPNAVPDLMRLGFRFPTLYRDVLVASELFNRRAEVRRQEALYRVWRMELPPRYRPWAGRPCLLDQTADEPVPFSRLTLTAQLEVLACPAEVSWGACLSLNPWLAGWRKPAAAGELPPVPWPPAAVARVSGLAYGRNFKRILGRVAHAPVPPAAAAEETQDTFVRQRLNSAHLFPLLWSPTT